MLKGPMWHSDLALIPDHARNIEELAERINAALTYHDLDGRDIDRLREILQGDTAWYLAWVHRDALDLSRAEVLTAMERRTPPVGD
jgi:hypothetical protein